jgi:hypothetical protein
MDNEKLQAGFVRNRRFLIGASLALAFTLLLGIQFKQISFLGNSGDVPHPEQVIWIIWVVWAWSLAQYIVWFRDVGAWQEFRSAVSGACTKHLGEEAAKKPLPQWLETQLGLIRNLGRTGAHVKLRANALEAREGLRDDEAELPATSCSEHRLVARAIRGAS